MMHEGSVSLFQYWNRLRGSRSAPRRTDIEPADIRSLLADTFILERDVRGEPVFRLAGTRLCAVFGRELKGVPFAALWEEKDRRLASRLVQGSFQQNSVVVISLSGESRTGRSNGFELLVLPLDGGVNNPRALGSLSAMKKPFWLGADPLVRCRIDTLRVVDPDREPLFLANRPAVPAPSLMPGAASLSMQRTGRRFRHLVVFDGGRDE